MTKAAKPARPRRQVGAELGRALAVLLLVICFFVAAMRLIGLIHPLRLSGHPFLDFEDFQLVGSMALHGRIAEAYASYSMFLAQTANGAAGNFLPWTYPPQFDLVVAGLAAIPQTWGYVLLVLLPLAAYLWLIWRLAGRQAAAVVVAMAPAILICVICGQNGFLTAALIGFFALLSLNGRSLAGLPLGLMAIKPHLGLTLGLQALAAGRWRLLALALAVVALSSAAATLAFGPAVWSQFLVAAETAGGNLRAHVYPLFRMVSLYALLKPLGVPPGLALAAQLGLAFAAALGLLWTIRRGAEPRLTLGVAVLGALAISPYAYDYDVPILGIGLALLAPPLAARLRRGEWALLWLGAWVAGGSGTANSIWHTQMLLDPALLPYSNRLPGLGAFGYLLILALTLRVLRRVLATQPGAAPARGTPRFGATSAAGVARPER